MIGGSDRRQALAPGAAAVAQDGPPAPGRVAAQKTMLPLSADFRRLILSLHKIISESGPTTGERCRCCGQTPFSERESITVNNLVSSGWKILFHHEWSCNVALKS
jgi:hypothetical protein